MAERYAKGFVHDFYGFGKMYVRVSRNSLDDSREEMSTSSVYDISSNKVYV